jgi:hypothetical protein
MHCPTRQLGCNTPVLALLKHMVANQCSFPCSSLSLFLIVYFPALQVLQRARPSAGLTDWVEAQPH